MRLVVREVVQAAVDRRPHDDAEHDGAGHDDGPRRRGGPLEEVRRGDERERGEVDEVSLDDEAREARREVRPLDRGIPGEAHDGTRGDGDERPNAWPLALARGHSEHGEERDRRDDPDPDRERAAGPAAVLDHPPFPVSGRRLPLARPMTDERDDRDQGAGGERPEADVVPGRPRRAVASHPGRAPAEHEEPRGERAEERDELRPDEHRDDTGREREGERRPGRSVRRAHREPQGERGGGIRPRLLDENRRVRERRGRDRRHGGEQGPARCDHPSREEIGGEDRSRHHERLDGLDRLVRARHRMDPPERRGEVGDEAREAVRLAAAHGMTGVGDRARDLRRLELVGEDRRRLAAPRLPGVERREQEVGADQRDQPLDPRTRLGDAARNRVRGCARRGHSASACETVRPVTVSLATTR